LPETGVVITKVEAVKEEKKQEDDKDSVIEFSGVSSSVIPRFELIPRSTLESLANRFALGLEKATKHGTR
jgi:hypothetical protein